MNRLFRISQILCSTINRIRKNRGTVRVLFVVARVNVLRTQSFALVLGALLLTITSVAIYPYTRSERAYAATNSNINFQARVLTAAGGVVPDGAYNVQFNLYSVASGGSSLWTETYLNSNAQGIVTKNGYITASLGSITAFPNTIPWDQELWIGMTVRGTDNCAFAACTPADAEMTPRMKVTAVPYAFRAAEASQIKTINGANVSTLSIVAPTGGSQTFTIPDQGAAGNYTILTQNAANASYIQNQSSTPQTANYYIQSAGNSTVGAIVRGAVGQSAALMRYENSAGDALAVFGANGQLTLGNDAASPQIGSITFNDGTGSNGFTAVLTSAAALTANVTYRLPVAGAGTYDICTSAGNCLGGGDIIQNGNSYNAPIYIGSNDNFDVNIETNGTNRLTVQNDGDIAFDTNTLFVDAANNFVGILNSTPGNPLSVNTPTTADSFAQTMISTGAVGNKGLVVQGVAGQSAAILEVQSSTGTAYLRVANNGTVSTSTSIYTPGISNTGSNNNSWLQMQDTGTHISTSIAANIALKLQNTNATPTGDLLQNLNTGSVVLSGFNASGNLFYSNSTYNSVLSSAVLTDNRSIVLPNESGTVCIQNSTNCGFALASGSGSYVQFAGTSAQADATNNSSIYINKTSGTGNILQLQKSGSDKLIVTNAGNVGISATGANPLSVNNLTTADALAQVAISTGATTNRGLVIQGVAGQTADFMQVQDSTGAPVLRVYGDGGGMGTNTVYVNYVSNQSTGNNALIQPSATGTVITTAVAGNIALTLQNTNATPTGDLLQVKNTGGTVMTKINSSGALIGGLTGAGYNLDGQAVSLSVGSGSSGLATIFAQNPSAGRIGGIIRGAASQTADLLQLQNSSNNVLSYFNANGDLSVGGVNSAASASALVVKNTTGASVFNVDTTNSRVGVGTSSPAAALDVRGNSTVYNGTGTISSSGATVTGAGTSFLTELRPGDVITAGGQSRVVGVITSDTVFQTANGVSFSPVIAAGTNFTYTQASQRIVNSADQVGLVIQGSAGQTQKLLDIFDSTGQYVFAVSASGSTVMAGDLQVNTGLFRSAIGTAATFYSADYSAGNTQSTTLRSGNAGAGNSGNVIVDAGTATGTTGIISVGTANASAITLGRSGITTTNAGALTVSQLLTGNLGTTISGAAISLNDNSNFNTTINTGTSTGTVTIGNGTSTAGTIALQGGAGSSFSATNATGTTKLGFAAPSTAGTVTFQLPAGGTGGNTYDICTTLSVCTGYAPASGSSNYIQNLNYAGAGSPQSANIFLSSAGANADPTVVIKMTATQTGNPLQIRNSSDNIIAKIDVSGNLAFAGGLSSIDKTSGTTSDLTMRSGNNTGGAAGNVIIDSGTATTTTGTISIGTANASGVTMGRAGQTTVLQGSSIALNSDTLSTNQATIALLNTVATTVNAFGAATVLNFGADTGTTTINNSVTLGSSAADLITVNGILQGGNPLVFEGSGADANETTFQITNPSADRTIIFPNADGTVVLDTTLTTNGDLLYHNGTIVTRLARGNSGDCLTSDGTTLQWLSCAAGVTLQNAYDNSTGGIITVTATDGALRVRDAASSFGNSSIFAVQNNAGTADYVAVTGAGNVVFDSVDNVMYIDETNNRVGINTGAPSADLSFGSGANRNINVVTTSSNAAGYGLTVSAGAAGAGASAFAGGTLTLQGGAAAGTGNANGGGVTVTGGAGTGTGVLGLVSLAPTTFASAAVQSFAVSGSLSAGLVDTYSTIPVNVTATSVTVSVPDPNSTMQAVIGRVLYISARGTASDFTLTLNSARTPINIAMKANSTATLIWNGTDWTAAGASSSTTLQAAYDNTLTAAGGAEIVLNNTASSNGLTVRNNATTPIIGGIFEAQTSIGTNLFSVNNNATEYATNGGAETQGTSASTFPINTWAVAPSGGTVDRYTTAGDNIATGQASVRVQTTTAANTGVANRLATALTANQTYSVAFAVRAATNFATLQAVYSPDGTNTGTVTCATAQTATSGGWTRIDCTFIASGSITANNAIIIRQTDTPAAGRTFYVENLSVTVNASATFAADGSVDSPGGFATNWTAYGAGSTAARDTSVIYDSSASARVDTTNSADRGIRNNLAITPSTSTQYLVSFYAKSATGSINDLTVRYSRDGGTALASCVDYNTQVITTSTWTKISCLFTTDGTTATDPDLIFTQATAPGGTRSIYIDALSVTLNTNNSSNVQIGGGNEGGPTTLFTLDRASSAPIAGSNDAYLGSMYYDTTSGRIQCYEADGWGACGSAPDNIVNLNPEYAGAVLNGTGIGTMTADFCGNGGGLAVNTGFCASGEARNFYKWTSPQATQQTYSIYVTYQLPSSFKGFANDDTVQLTARTDNTTNGVVSYQMYRNESGVISACGTETTVTSSANTWQTVGINGNEATGCSFTTSSANAFVIFKINVKANSNASVYVGTLSFTTTGR